MPWLSHQPQAYPVTLWDVHGRSGHPLRTTLSEMGPLLLGSLLQLTDSQQAALYAAFKVADREGLLLLDLKDLKALLAHLKAEPQLLGEDSALFTGASSQALLRRLATLEQQGAEALFGEPALQLEDLLHPAADGRGPIHLLDASVLVHEAPKVLASISLLSPQPICLTRYWRSWGCESSMVCGHTPSRSRKHCARWLTDFVRTRTLRRWMC